MNNATESTVRGVFNQVKVVTVLVLFGLLGMFALQNTAEVELLGNI